MSNAIACAASAGEGERAGGCTAGQLMRDAHAPWASAAERGSLHHPGGRERREDRDGGADHLLGPAAEPRYVVGQEHRARHYSAAGSAATEGSSLSQTSPKRD